MPSDFVVKMGPQPSLLSGTGGARGVRVQATRADASDSEQVGEYGLG